jgi:MFS family permease
VPKTFNRSSLKLSPERKTVLRAILGLGTTQVIGWGTIFSPLTIFGTQIANDLHIEREFVFGGITVMLLTSACLAPRIGRLTDRIGAQTVMIIGSLIAALAMVMSSVVFNLVSWLLCWVLVGLAVPMMLNNTAMPGLVQVVGPNARRAITGLTLISGLTSTVFMPLNQYLLETIGWRHAYLVFALMHIFLCAPIHAIVLARRASASAPRDTSARDPAPVAPVKPVQAEGILPAEYRRGAFVLLAVWTCTEGLITWGLYLQIIDVFKAEGLTAIQAIGVWALVGPAQATARMIELIFGARHSILWTAFTAALLNSLSFIFILPFDLTVTGAILFSVCLGTGHGLYAVASNTMPLTLFGSREYGSYMGLLLVPQNIVNAAAPILFAVVIGRVSPTAALWVTAIGAVTGFFAVMLLARYCRGKIGTA